MPYGNVILFQNHRGVEGAAPYGSNYKQSDKSEWIGVVGVLKDKRFVTRVAFCSRLRYDNIKFGSLEGVFSWKWYLNC